MRQLSLLIAVALLGMSAAGCADPYQPRYGYAYQTYSYPSSYTVYRTAPAQVAYVYPGYSSTSYYRSYDYDRYYMGMHHPGPELRRAFP